MLLDYGGLIVHVFTERAAAFLRSRATVARSAPHRVCEVQKVRNAVDGAAEAEA